MEEIIEHYIKYYMSQFAINKIIHVHMEKNRERKKGEKSSHVSKVINKKPYLCTVKSVY